MDEHTYDGDPISIVRAGKVELTQVAEDGQEGIGTLTLDDQDGTQEIVGQKDWAVTEADCANTHTYSGFVDDRQYGRDEDVAAVAGDARAIVVQLVDLNNYLSQTGITGTDGNRKDANETVNERLAWLFGSDYWPSQVAIGSRVASSTMELDKADYRQQQPGDVLADIAAATGWNRYVADWGSGPELTFRDDNASTDDTSAIRISNVIADVDSDPETLGTNKTFYPSMDFKLSRSPREVYSKMSLSYGKGTRTKSKASTAAAFNGERYGTASTSNIKTASLADDELTRLLNVHSTERDFLEGSIIVPSSAVNLLRQGERMQVKFSHLGNTGGRDYDDWTWCRVMERTPVPLIDDAGMYELRLRLSPQETAPAPSTCAGLYPDTPAGIYYPLGGPKPCCTPNDVGTNIAYYFRSGWPEPWFPQPEYSGQWHFPTYGIGGVGTRDTFASGFGNILKFIVVGSGTLTIQTSQWQGQSQPYKISVWSNTLTTPVNSGTLHTGVAGDSTAVEITSDVDDCIHVIDLRADARSSSYIGMGWAQAEWVPA